ncbi:MAG TPA: 1-(5-phosphoribosyl)-5-[(5-phosphoribosylamino)methylideneamino]imidazole-4-carboxamide isomerase [Thermoleophilia bacterium]|nr:1-(5-phosphoribosyl)-5-[(5-phosphoribosylamino)methylideneamino]imidazole-4-carboxamide isomerase [Thermoleophilia bacterium]
MIVFPAVDIQGGKAVRLRRGDFDDVTVFGDDPVELARRWEADGAEALHVVDLDAARTGEMANVGAVERIVKALDIPVQYGGGVRSAENFARIAQSGVHWVVMGTAAVTSCDLLDSALGEIGDRLVVGMDCSGGMVATHGWQKRSQMSAAHFTRVLEERGVRRVVYTDVARDGMLRGPDLQGLEEFAVSTALEFIMSGGVASLDDLRQLVTLALPNVAGVIVGRAFYEGSFTLADAQAVLAG